MFITDNCTTCCLQLPLEMDLRLELTLGPGCGCSRLCKSIGGTKIWSTAFSGHLFFLLYMCYRSYDRWHLWTKKRQKCITSFGRPSKHLSSTCSSYLLYNNIKRICCALYHRHYWSIKQIAGISIFLWFVIWVTGIDVCVSDFSRTITLWFRRIFGKIWSWIVLLKAI